MKSISKRSKIILLLAGLVLLIGGISYGIVSLQPKRSEKSASQVTPSFPTLIPKNSTIDELGGWQALTPPSGETIYVYVDTVDGALLNVSQQRLPESFKANPANAVKDLAKAYNATTTVDAAGISVYIGTSANGPQSVIFTKDTVLILIKSDKKIQDSAWISYVRSLE